jgi:hypothetical protein
MLENTFHGILNPNKQRNDKIPGGHGWLSFRLSLNRIVSDVRDLFKPPTSTIGYIKSGSGYSGVV